MRCFSSLIAGLMWGVGAALLWVTPCVGADTIFLRYQFPPNFSAVVSTNRFMAAELNGKIVSSSISSAYRLSVSPSANNARQLRYQSLGRSVENGSSPSLIPFYKALIDISDRYFQSVIITPSANLQFQNFQMSVRSATEAAYKLAKTPASKQLVASVFDPNAIRYAEEDQWMRMVQMWDGVSAVVGTWYQARGSEYLPQLGRIVACDFYFRVRTRVPCEIAGDCVLIEAKSVPDAAEVRAILAESNTAGSPMQPAQFVTIFSVVTDPKTLCPVLYVESRESLIGSQVALSTVKTTFRYPPRRLP